MFTLIAACIGAAVGIASTVTNAVMADKAQDAAEAQQQKQLDAQNQQGAANRAKELKMAKATASSGSLEMARQSAQAERTPVHSRKFKEANTPFIVSRPSGSPNAVA